MKVLVTGGEGFVGWHLRSLLLTQDGVEVDYAGRAVFDQPVALSSAVQKCDVVMHLAGVNRAEESVIRQGNVDAAKSLVSACEVGSARPHVIFASSTHIERNPPSVYGEAKMEAAAVLSEWAAREGARFTELVIPHVFGEYGRPFYNSAVATFCHQLAHGEVPTIEKDIDLELIHVQDLCDEILEKARTGETGRFRLKGVSIRVSEVLGRLQAMQRTYDSGVLPDLSDPFSLRLFNTLRSFYYPKRYPWVVALHSDQRGRLFETVKALSGGQCFISTTKPGITRGGHFHRHKFERFMVIQGKATIRIRRLFESEPMEFRVDGDTPALVDIPTLQTHDITNTGDQDLLTLFWAHEIFDPEHPDTYAHPVTTGKGPNT